MRRILSDAQALRAVREFFTSASHAPCMRYRRAPDGDPMWVECGYPGCVYVVELGMAA
jgi:hypothetical protein